MTWTPEHAAHAWDVVENSDVVPSSYLREALDRIRELEAPLREVLVVDDAMEAELLADTPNPDPEEWATRWQALVERVRAALGRTE